MLKFVLQKLLSKKWMVLSLLIGNLLMIAVAAASPMYFQAVLQRTLTQNMGKAQAESSLHVGMAYQKIGYAPYSTPSRVKDRALLTKLDQNYRQLMEDLEAPALADVRNYYRDSVMAERTVSVQGKDTLRLSLHSYSNIEDHIRITHGRMCSDTVENNIIEVIVSQRTYLEQRLELEEVLTLPSLTDASETPYQIRVVGIFENTEAEDPYWLTSPAQWTDTCIVTQNVFLSLFANPDNPVYTFTLRWHTVLDYTQFQAENVEQYLSLMDAYTNSLKELKTETPKFYFQETMQEYLPIAVKLQTTMTVLLVPVFLLLAAFIFMVSRQMLQMEENEISVFKSRGASKLQLIAIYLLQSTVIALIGVAGGVPMGYLLCSFLGASDAFLELLQRVALPVKIVPAVWFFAGAAALFCIGTMVLPVFRFANVTIVAHKREKSRKKKRTWWKILCLDGVLLAVSLYGWKQFQGQIDYLTENALNNKPMDPMLYLYSALFMLGAALLVLRLIPLVVRLIYWLGKRLWPPALYASFLRIMRSNQNQGFLVVFLVLTVAMGIFNSLTARTVNANAETQMRYSVGASVVLREPWSSKEEKQDKYDGITTITYDEPEYGKYLAMEGIESVTKVLRDDGTQVQAGNNTLRGVTLMGIHTKEFGETAWFDESLLPVHWYEYLNAMSQDPNAVLVSSNFRDDYGLKVGDSISYTTYHGTSDGIRKTARGTIYGFVDYWPGYMPTRYALNNKAVLEQMDNYLVVANLPQLQFDWGVTPYEVWIKASDSTQFIYDYAQEHGLYFEYFTDVNAELAEMKTDPAFQATNGILTVGFIIVLILCATGFLIYWILSIQSRALQFGIFRAMGMRTGGILGMLVNEQVFISGISIGAGVVVGYIASQLYVPLIQIVYSSTGLGIASNIVSQASDYLRLGAVIGLMITVCMTVLGILISRLQITQALKLGED